MEKATVKPSRVRYWSDHLSVTAVHGKGWRAGCSCGWVSREYMARGEALKAKRRHQFEHTGDDAA